MIEIKAIAAGIVAAGSIVGGYTALAAFGIVNPPVFKPALAGLSRQLAVQRCGMARLRLSINRNELRRTEREVELTCPAGRTTPYCLRIRADVRDLIDERRDLRNDATRFCK